VIRDALDRAALDQLPGRQRAASWVVCRVATVSPRRQETVPMARSDALTLLDVMQAVREAAANEQETLATVVHLIASGQVRLSDDAMKAIQELSAITDVAA
jgi:hypothetical protein